MTLTQIRYFLEVSQCLNLSIAAQRLFISQPNLSKYISQMEEELGYPLLIRGNRGVRLTPGGEQFLRHIRVPYYDLIHNIQLSASLGQRQTICMALPHEQQIPDFLLSLLRTWNCNDTLPNIIVAYDNPSRMATKLLAGEYDLLISSEPDVENTPGLSCTSLFPLKSVLAYSAQHVNAGKEDLTLLDFAEDYFLVSLNESSQQLQYSAKYIEFNYGFQPKFLYTDSTSSSLLNVISGLGVTIIPELYIRSDMTQLQTLPIADIEPHWCNIICRTDEADTQTIALRDAIYDMFQARPDLR